MSPNAGHKDELMVNALRYMLGKRGFEVRVSRQADDYVVTAFHPESGKRYSARSARLHTAVGAVADQSGDDVRRQWGE